MDIENTVLVRIKKTSNLLDRFMAEVKSNIERKVDEAKDISPIQGRIIMFLDTESKKGEVFQKDIETHFDIRSSTAAINLRRMENSGLITRRVDADDVRKKTVSLTQKSKRSISQARTELENAERRATKGLTRKELDLFFQVLDKITENIS